MERAMLPGGTSGANRERYSPWRPLLQPLPWFLERVPVHGVEGVAAGARGCLGYPSAAAYLEAPSRGGKKDPHWGAKGERPIGASPDPGATGQGRGGTRGGRATWEKATVPGEAEGAKEEQFTTKPRS